MDKEYVAGTYNRFPVELDAGKGSMAFGTNGERYIDMTSGIGVTALGFADDGWIAAVTQQLHLIQHTSNLFYTAPCAELAKALCDRTGMKKVFFSNSGAEANECAIKVARKYSAEKKGDDHYTIITLVNSFHGRTLTTLAATGQEHFHKLFNPLTPGFVSVEANNVAALEEAVATCKPAGILFEVIQGEGGVLPLTAEFVAAAARLAKDNDIPLIVDEVQTGNGRTGKLYGYMHFGIQPDIVSTAKGLGGGLPIGATLLGEKVQNVLGPGDHGSTYGGNPICCAAALHVIKQLDDEFLAQVRARSEVIFSSLAGAPGIESVSGMGLMIGIKPTGNTKKILNYCMDRGILCLTAKDKLRLLPALNIPMDELQDALIIIQNACAAFKEEI